MRWPKDLDDLIDGTWLWKRRRFKRITRLEIMQYHGMIGEKGLCIFVGQTKPWNGKLCECTGYVFKESHYNEAYCECGCNYKNHRRKYPIKQY